MTNALDATKGKRLCNACGLQKQLNAEPYGPSLADVEKQIAAHNILHQAIEAYDSQLTPATAPSQVHVWAYQHVRAPRGMSELLIARLLLPCVYRSSMQPSETNINIFM